ncbi:protein IQ-DOMAIN 11 isoform X2 [Euphorbia lathyris]|uniref:protein IQ-DOMAIN 11 isoform X2 n=1 Tax=Euphorbia lathyris TaxID=212925 RepID=UPI0033135305
MAKKRSWFNVVRRFFISEAQEKKDKRRKWVFFGRMKLKNRLPSISAPLPLPINRATLCEAEEEQSKRALDVALATAAAAEAAVAAAHAAAEVVLLTGASYSACQCDKKVKVEEEEKEKDDGDKEKKHGISAIIIQSSFRGYLARKALRALKGIVKLQAIIRGRNVRRQAMNTLKCLQSIVNIQSQVSAKRIQIAAEGSCFCDENEPFGNVSNDKIIKMDTNSQKRWDGSILTKEEAKALFLSKKEASIKRERIKEYSFNHRNSAETERNSNGRWRYWLEQWVDTQVSKSKELEDLDTISTSNPKQKLEFTSEKSPISTPNPKQNLEFRSEKTPISTPNPKQNLEFFRSEKSPILTAPRRSFHRKQNSLGEESSFTRSPTRVPTYMASTESAKAKARSMSSPKLRPASYDAYSDSYNSPSKNNNRLSLITSSNGGRLGFGYNHHQQRSPSLKGIPGAPVKSNHANLKDLSFDSDCSFRTWNHQISGNFV